MVVSFSGAVPQFVYQLLLPPIHSVVAKANDECLLAYGGGPQLNELVCGKWGGWREFCEVETAPPDVGSFYELLVRFGSLSLSPRDKAPLVIDDPTDSRWEDVEQKDVITRPRHLDLGSIGPGLDTECGDTN